MEPQQKRPTYSDLFVSFYYSDCNRHIYMTVFISILCKLQNKLCWELVSKSNAGAKSEELQFHAYDDAKLGNL